MEDTNTRSQFKASVRAANDFSLACLGFLKRKEARQQAAWLRTSVGASRALLQPWNLELLYVIATLERARFSTLLDLLQVSSRTLSDKLKLLRQADLIERHLHDEQPIRIEYSLTKSGRMVAALAAPLLAHVGHEALQKRVPRPA